MARANLHDLQYLSDKTALSESNKVDGQVDFDAPLRPLFTGSPRVDMKLLLVTSTADNPNLKAISYFAKELGVPFDTLIATQENLTQNKLIKANGDGKYQGIILTEVGLAYNNNGVYESAFSTAEWNLLWQYEREFNVRQVAINGFPSTFPEDYGLRFASSLAVTEQNPITATLTTDGKTVFESLKPDIVIPIKNAFVFRATTCGSACPNVTTKPLIKDNTGKVLAALSTTADGREVLSMTFSHNSFLRHTGLLSYDLISWVTNGIFIGERRYYFSIDIDDWYLESEMWNPATNSMWPEDEYQFRIVAKDVYAARDGVIDLRNRFPSPNFNYNQVFNAEKAETGATRSCAANASLSAATLCVADFFPFISHTFTHAEMDFLNYADAKGEFENNMTFAEPRLDTFEKEYVVTGKHSGLGWYRLRDAPTGQTCLYDIVPGDPFCQFGLDASNTAMLQAAVDLGVKYLAANRGWQSHTAECDSCLIDHPLEPRIKLVPRWPTNIFFNASTPEENTSEFNYLYGPQGILTDGSGNPYFPTNKTWQDIVGFETDIAIRHVLSFSPYPHFVHQANIREYAAGRSLTYDFAEDVLKTYSQYFNIPLVSQNWVEIADTLEKRTSFYNAGASGVINKLDNTVTIKSANGGTVFVTGADFENRPNFSYGGKTVSELNLTAGQSISSDSDDGGNVPDPGNLLTNGGFEANLTAWSSCGSGQTNTVTDADEGTKAIKLQTSGGAGACLFQEVTAIPNKTYTFSCMAKRNVSSSWSSISLGFSNANYSSVLATDVKEITGSNYNLHSISLAAPTNAAHVAVTLYSEDAATYDNCNLLVDSNTGPPDPPTPSTSLLANTDFENNLDAWTLKGCGTGTSTSVNTASNGTKAMQIAGPTVCIGQGIAANGSTITGNKTYVLSCDVKNSGGTYADMSLYADGTLLGFKQLTGSSFNQISFTGTSPATVNYMYVYFYKGEGGSIIIDNCNLSSP